MSVATSAAQVLALAARSDSIGSWRQSGFFRRRDRVEKEVGEDGVVDKCCIITSFLKLLPWRSRTQSLPTVWRNLPTLRRRLMSSRSLNFDLLTFNWPFSYVSSTPFEHLRSRFLLLCFPLAMHNTRPLPFLNASVIDSFSHLPPAILDLPLEEPCARTVMNAVIECWQG
ncbi:hypothetical protein CPC08DRAFT_452146 [Agrocybe pediades]|nr:hypothetical protein CPC08DRAFT_452146 [Agrocybe pediades]